MIRLIVGLGNPGSKYVKTRHNVGFLFLDYLLGQGIAEWNLDPRFEGYLANLAIGGFAVNLLKPNTYMNRSGQSVGKFARYFKLDPKHILVVHDELDFDVGVAKLKKGGGHGGHNGLRDIISHLGSSDFYRLRIGIGRPRPGINVADYVLSSPDHTEFETLSQIMALCERPVGLLVGGDEDRAVNEINAPR